MSSCNRLVVLGPCQISRTEQKVVAPFPAVILYVHKGDANAGREIKGCDPGTVNINRKTDEGRPVRLFVGHDAEARHTVLDKAFVTQAVELPLTSDAIKTDVKGCKIEGTAN